MIDSFASGFFATLGVIAALFFVSLAVFIIIAIVFAIADGAKARKSRK